MKKRKVRKGASRLILVRHAHRDKPFGPEFDNGLSEKGHRQAKKVARRLKEYIDGSSCILYSSPKKRCVETADKIGDTLHCKSRRWSLLNEHSAGAASLKNIFGRVLNKIKKSRSEVLIIVGHGDWLPSFAQYLTGAVIELKKAAWLEVKLEGQRPRLYWLEQS